MGSCICCAEGICSSERDVCARRPFAHICDVGREYDLCWTLHDERTAGNGWGNGQRGLCTGTAYIRSGGTVERVLAYGDPETLAGLF